VPIEKVAIAVKDPEAAIAKKEQKVLSLESSWILDTIARVKVLTQNTKKENCCK